MRRYKGTVTEILHCYETDMVTTLGVEPDLTAHDLLELEIIRWEVAEEYLREQDTFSLELDVSPMCRRFHPGYGNGKEGCLGCPIAEYTGAGYCLAVPEPVYVHLRDNWASAPEQARKCVLYLRGIAGEGS